MRITVLIILLACGLIAFEAQAQPACMSHGKMVDLLAGRYSEQQISAGLESSGQMIELFATDDGATWTPVMTSPHGVACVVATGLEWQKSAKSKDNGT